MAITMAIIHGLKYDEFNVENIYANFLRRN